MYLLFSCTPSDKNSTKQSDSEIAINHNLELFTKDALFADKVKHVNKAVQLAKQSNDPSLYFQTIIYKLDSVIIPNYPDSTLFYLNQLSNLAPKTENHEFSSAYVTTKRGEHALQLKDYKKAYSFYNESKESFEKQSDSLMIGYNLLKIANIHEIYGEYSDSEEAITKALTFLEKREDSKWYLREANNMLGISYTGLKNYPEAIRYYKKAIALTDNLLLKKMIENNIGLIYLEEGQYDKAIGTFELLAASAIVKADSSFLPKVLDNLGFSKFKKEGNSGKELMEQALAIRTARGDEKGMVYNYLNLSEYYGTKDPVLATNYAQKAYSKATKIGAVDNRLKALELLVTYGDKHYSQQYFRLKDSVEDSGKMAKNEFAKMRFDFTKQKNESLVQQAEDKVRYLTIGSTLITIILVVVILFILAQIRHKKEKRIEGYKAETRIAKKLHDELANDIFNTMTFAEIQDLSTHENKETLLDNLDKIYTQTRNISKENHSIDTGQNYPIHLKEMLSGYGSEEVNIILKEIETIDWQTIESAHKIVVYRILQELLVNMKKHSKATLVVISFQKINKKIQINYSDNGVGMGPDEHLRKNGLQNVENRIQSINGTITFDPTPQKGFKVNFSFNT